MGRIGTGQAPTFASLFSGCGGFDLGFVMAGYRCIGAFDIDPLAVQVHNLNIGSSATVCDLSERSTPAHKISIPDILLAGSPCQGFSTVGKRELKDPRNDLLIAAGRIAANLKPPVVVFENVPGVIAGSHKTYWERLREILSEAGYRTAEIICDAHRLGVPQLRRRIMMIAWRGGYERRIVLPESPPVSLTDSLRGLQCQSDHVPKDLSSRPRLQKIAARIRPGQKLSNVRGGSRAVHTWEIPEVFGKTTVRERQVLEMLMRLRRRNRVRQTGDADPVRVRELTAALHSPTRAHVEALIVKRYVRRIGAAVDLAHTFNGKCRRLDWESPSPTVDTKFGDPWYFLHPSEDRALTVREAARIQGFPDTFSFEGTDRARFRMVGNAVPPPVALTLASFIRTALLEQ